MHMGGQNEYQLHSPVSPSELKKAVTVETALPPHPHRLLTCLDMQLSIESHLSKICNKFIATVDF